MKVHRCQEVLQLEAGEAKLTVTGNHRLMVPAMEGHQGVQDMLATKLGIGDVVICKTAEGSTVEREITDILVMTVEDSEQFEVFEITFKPDVPVAVFQVPSEILLSKGFKKKPARHAIKAKAGNTETVSVAGTAAGEYTD